MMALAGIADLLELLIPQLLARLAERFEGVLRLAGHDDVRHETQEVALAGHVGQVPRDAYCPPKYLLRNAGLRAELLLILLEHSLMLAHDRNVPTAQITKTRILCFSLVINQGVEEHLVLRDRVVHLAAQELYASVHTLPPCRTADQCKL